MNPRTTFETFVVGPSNQLACAASFAVAQSQAHACNPLFIHGAAGTGKSHLMQAIEHGILQRNPETRVTYLSAEKFTNEYIRAIQENALPRFRRRYHILDALLLDDIQYLPSEEHAPNGFFQILTNLFEERRQVVLSADHSAANISQLTLSLLMHIERGLSVEIQPPDLASRIAILQAKTAIGKMSLPAPVIEFIAQRLKKNIRCLEGALFKVSSYAASTGKPIDLPAAESLLTDMLIEEI